MIIRTRTALDARLAVAATLALLSTTALAQSPVQWQHNPTLAIADAQRLNRPIFFYVPPSRHAKRDADNIVDAIQETLRDPDVVAIVAERYVPVRVQRANTNDKL